MLSSVRPTKIQGNNCEHPWKGYTGQGQREAEGEHEGEVEQDEEQAAVVEEEEWRREWYLSLSLSLSLYRLPSLSASGRDQRKTSRSGTCLIVERKKRTGVRFCPLLSCRLSPAAVELRSYLLWFGLVWFGLACFGDFVFARAAFIALLFFDCRAALLSSAIALLRRFILYALQRYLVTLRAVLSLFAWH